MPTRKHLVLEDDVYEDLIARREMSGLPLGKLGNAILRAHIRSAIREDMVGHKLVEMGLLSSEEYREILNGVSHGLKHAFAPGSPPLERGEDGVTSSGSWILQSIVSPPGGGFQLIEAWAKDNLQRPMGQHEHPADEYLIGLGGRTLFVLNGVPCTLRKKGIFEVPAGVVHSAMPLSEESHLLILMIPAVPEYKDL